MVFFVFFLEALMQRLLVPGTWDTDLFTSVSGQLVVPLFKLYIPAGGLQLVIMWQLNKLVTECTKCTQKDANYPSLI